MTDKEIINMCGLSSRIFFIAIAVICILGAILWELLSPNHLWRASIVIYIIFGIIAIWGIFEAFFGGKVIVYKERGKMKSRGVFARTYLFNEIDNFSIGKWRGNRMIKINFLSERRFGLKDRWFRGYNSFIKKNNIQKTEEIVGRLNNILYQYNKKIEKPETHTS